MIDAAKEVESVYQLLSVITVSGDAVDAMAAARSKLRKLYAELQGQPEAEGSEE